MKDNGNEWIYTVAKQVSAWWQSMVMHMWIYKLQMPRIYQRKCDTRGKWTEENLRKAINCVKEKTLSINASSRLYGIPSRTLRRYIKQDLNIKRSLGPSSFLGDDAEQKIVSHIQQLQSCGFSPTRQTLRSLAFDLAKEMNLKMKFNANKQLAGRDWLEGFLRRHPELSIGKAKDSSVTQTTGISREETLAYFCMLEKMLVEDNLISKPMCIYNVDVVDLRLDVGPGKIIVAEDTKDVRVICSAEKGEIVSVIICCNAEGNFLPPFAAFEDIDRKMKFDDMIPGLTVITNKKSDYINSDIFMLWLKEHFIPRKPFGTTLLILGRLSAHCNSLEVLEFARENKILLLCLPNHTAKFLQPLDKSFFRSLRSYFYGACQAWMTQHQGQKLTHLQFGKLFATAWLKSATLSNGISGFRATGIYPLNPKEILEHSNLQTTLIQDTTIDDEITEGDASQFLQIELIEKSGQK